jgi:hypothetical protein
MVVDVAEYRNLSHNRIPAQSCHSRKRSASGILLKIKKDSGHSSFAVFPAFEATATTAEQALQRTGAGMT